MKRIHLAVYVREDEASTLRAFAAKTRHRNVSEWAREVLLREAGAKAGQGATKPRSKKET